MRKSLSLSLVVFTMALTLVLTGATIVENTLNESVMLVHDGPSNDVEVL